MNYLQIINNIDSFTKLIDDNRNMQEFSNGNHFYKRHLMNTNDDAGNNVFLFSAHFGAHECINLNRSMQ